MESSGVEHFEEREDIDLGEREDDWEEFAVTGSASFNRYCLLSKRTALFVIYLADLLRRHAI